MQIVYYNAKSNSIFLIDSDEDSSLMMYYVLEYKSRDHGWVCLGEL